MFRLLTPGGGGFGPPEDGKETGDERPPHKRRKTDAVASQHYFEKGSVYAYKLAQESA